MKCPKCGDNRAQQLLVNFLCANHHCENFDEGLATEKLEICICGVRYQHTEGCRLCKSCGNAGPDIKTPKTKIFTTGISVGPMSPVLSTTSSTYIDALQLTIVVPGSYVVVFSTRTSASATLAIRKNGEVMFSYKIPSGAMTRRSTCMSSSIYAEPGDRISASWKADNVDLAVMYDRELKIMKEGD